MISNQKSLKQKMSYYFPLGKTIYKAHDYSGLWLSKDNPKQVIKIFLISNTKSKFKQKKRLNDLFNYLVCEKNPSIVKIYDYGFIEENNNLYFYYIMEKLEKFNMKRVELELWTDIINQLYSYIKQYNYHPNYNFGLSSKIKKFILNISNIDYYYDDLHCYNLMVDNKGNIKLIDLESFI